MKITRNFILSLCIALLSVQVFAVSANFDFDEFVENGSKSIYAEDVDRIASEVEAANMFRGWEDIDIVVDPNTIMPMYTASMLDYARTGKFEITPYLESDTGEPSYMAETLDNATGEPHGVTIFSCGAYAGFQAYGENEYNPNRTSPDFKANAEIIWALLEPYDFDSASFSILNMYVEGVGYCYYVADRDKEAIIPGTYNACNDYFFRSNDADGEYDYKKAIAILDDEKLEQAKQFLAAAEEKQMEYEKLIAENPELALDPPTGGSNLVGGPILLADLSNANSDFDEFVENGSKSIYPENLDEIINAINNLDSDDQFYKWCETQGMTINVDTIMPMYTANMLDYAKTGKLEIAPRIDFTNGEQEYMAETLDKFTGEPKGVIIFYMGEQPQSCAYLEYVHNPHINSPDFIANAETIWNLIEPYDFDSASFSILNTYIEFIGYCYYVADKDKEAIIPGYRGCNDYFFRNGDTEDEDGYYNDDSFGVALLNDEKLERAKQFLAETEKRAVEMEIWRAEHPGENPPTGTGIAGSPVTLADLSNSNSRNVPETGVEKSFNYWWILSGILMLTFAGRLIYLRKTNRRI